MEGCRGAAPHSQGLLCAAPVGGGGGGELSPQERVEGQGLHAEKSSQSRPVAPHHPGFSPTPTFKWNYLFFVLISHLESGSQCPSRRWAGPAGPGRRKGD